MKTIAFSGGCYSGKTTAIKMMRHHLECDGHKVIVLSELMRDHKITSIDELRKNPSKYLKLQEEIIEEKITQELGVEYHAIKQNLILAKNGKQTHDYIVMIDRAITDSLFYLLFYLDKSQLNSKELVRYENLYNFVDNCAHLIFSSVYDNVLLFKPLAHKSEYDKYRPKDIDVLKHTEYRFISTLTKYYGAVNDTPVHEIDMNTCVDTPEDIVEHIMDIIQWQDL